MYILVFQNDDGRMEYILVNTTCEIDAIRRIVDRSSLSDKFWEFISDRLGYDSQESEEDVNRFVDDLGFSDHDLANYFHSFMRNECGTEYDFQKIKDFAMI